MIAQIDAPRSIRSTTSLRPPASPLSSARAMASSSHQDRPCVLRAARCADFNDLTPEHNVEAHLNPATGLEPAGLDVILETAQLRNCFNAYKTRPSERSRCVEFC